MLKTLIPVILYILVLTVSLAACSDPTATSTPTATPAPQETPTEALIPVPTPVPASTASLEPRVSRTPANSPATILTPVPTPMPAGTSTLQPKTNGNAANTPTSEPSKTLAPNVRLAPLQLVDSDSFRSALSEAELSCTSDDPEEQARLLDESGTASREESRRLLECLEDETMARFFLAGVIPGPEPFSLETSTCIRAVLEVINPRDVITAEIEGENGEAAASGLVAMLVTIACLNDDEWEKAAPRTTIIENDRISLQCVMRALGGPGPLTEAMQAELEGNSGDLATAATECAR